MARRRRRTTDAAVDSADMLTAIYEVRGDKVAALMERLWQTEPSLAVYVEGGAAHIAANLCRVRAEGQDDSTAADVVMGYALTIVRAMQHGQYRLWRDVLPPSSPLTRL